MPGWEVCGVRCNRGCYKQGASGKEATPDCKKGVGKECYDKGRQDAKPKVEARGGIGAGETYQSIASSNNRCGKIKQEHHDYSFFDSQESDYCGFGEGGHDDNN